MVFFNRIGSLPAFAAFAHEINVKSVASGGFADSKADRSYVLSNVCSASNTS
jgi:hypothetical protein